MGGKGNPHSVPPKQLGYKKDEEPLIVELEPVGNMPGVQET